MCGIVLVAGPRAAAPEAIEVGLDAIKHRGPDGRGIWRSADRQIALGHARLAVIDLSPSGAQPMCSRNGRSVIAFNGEIYNYRELAQGLGTPLRSNSDTEVLLELLDRQGIDALQRLRGMFAFAYWDGREVTLARDRVGIKPLFYAETANGLVAASELGAITATGMIERAPDPQAVDQYLTYLYVPAPLTGIKGVFELPPGHVLKWSPGKGVKIERYWRVPSRIVDAPSSEELRHLVEDAVKAHLVSDVPVGVFLSGGIDSSSITALAAAHYPGTLKTFTITFGDEGSYLDERRYAQEVSKRYGTEHLEIQVQPDAASILPQMIKHFGQPFGNPTAVLTYALSRETKRYVKVSLAGDGGDELLGGYPRYQGAWISETLRYVPPRLRAKLAQLLTRTSGPAGQRGRSGSRLDRFLASANLDPEKMYYRWITYHDAAQKNALFVDREALVGGDDKEYEFLSSLRGAFSNRSFRDTVPLIDLESFLPHNVLNYGDRMSMAHGLEVRVPFCDHLLIERLAPTSLASKMPGGVQKGLFRWAMRKDLPAPVLAHRKVGFNPPIAAWLARDLNGLVEDYLGESTVRRRGWFRPEAVSKIRRGFTEGTLDAAYTLWSLVVLEAWFRWLEEEQSATLSRGGKLDVENRFVQKAQP